jgi:hypothetical protein
MGQLNSPMLMRATGVGTESRIEGMTVPRRLSGAA